MQSPSAARTASSVVSPLHERRALEQAQRLRSAAVGSRAAVRCGSGADATIRRPARLDALDALFGELSRAILARMRATRAAHRRSVRGLIPRAALALRERLREERGGIALHRGGRRLAGASGLPVPASIVPWRILSIFAFTSNSKPGSLASSWHEPQICRITHESHLSPSETIVPIFAPAAT